MAELKPIIIRDNPIPPGIYWIEFFGDPIHSLEKKVGFFRDWLTSNKTTVKRLREEDLTQKEMLIPLGLYGLPFETVAAVLGIPMRESIKGEFGLFQVLQPTSRWLAEHRLGLPTIAVKGTAETARSVIQSPEIGTGFEILSESMFGPKEGIFGLAPTTKLKLVLGAILVIPVAWLAASVSRPLTAILKRR